jgi:uncharacterized membrane protein
VVKYTKGDTIMDKKLTYIIVVVASVLFLLVGNRVAQRGRVAEDGYDMAQFHFRAIVTEIVGREDLPGWGGMDIAGHEISFAARVTSGALRGEEIVAVQQVLYMFTVNDRAVSPGDRVMLFHADWSDVFHFAGYVRIHIIIIVGIIFLALVIAFGRGRGASAILALGFTCMAIFFVFLPAILGGRNIYATTIVVCVFAIISTLFIVIGVNKKAYSAMLGCLGGVFLAGAMMAVMDRLLGLTGALDRDTEMLLHLQNPLDLRGLIFAGVVLGAVGAIMDVAMSIASSLWELNEAGGVTDFKSIVKSGINIGRDILGTMLNTLILAYIGSSMSLILLITAHNPVPMMLLNTEMIIVEFLRALVGSFGMLLAIPLTAVICGWLYSNIASQTRGKQSPEAPQSK